MKASTHWHSDSGSTRAAGSVQPRLLQRSCTTCGNQTISGSECESCASQQRVHERHAKSMNQSSEGPPIAHRALSGAGSPLDAVTRAFFEPRFGYDLGHVRVHTDARAAASARAMNALAYTVGRDIAFLEDQYAPGTSAGRRLLAHELTHVLQQSAWSHDVAPTGWSTEQEAQHNAEQVSIGKLKPVQIRASATTLQRQQPTQSQTALDQTALQIIGIAQNTQRDLALRAIEVVYRIISAYYPADASKISGVGFEDGVGGLVTDLSGPGPNPRAIVKVGKYFVENTNALHFARRVLQVGHEIEHISDWAAGMAGPRRSDEREFRAFYHAGIAQEKPHTGRMQHIDRVSQIDAALGYFNCLSQTLQQQYAKENQELLTRRPIEIRRSGRTVGPAPTSCARASN